MADVRDPMSVDVGGPTSAVVVGLPTRSELENVDTADFDDAAVRWRRAADESESVWAAHVHSVSSPAGTVWQGEAKEAVFERVSADVGIVSWQSDIQREAAGIAEAASAALRLLAGRAVDAIADAEEQGFVVGEDLSVRDTGFDPDSAAARQRVAAGHAEYIGWRAEQYLQAEAFAGEQLVAKAAELQGPRFAGESSDGSIQLVDNQFKLDPAVPAPPDPAPGGGDVRGVLDKLPAGSRPTIREVRSVAELDKIWEWVQRSGKPVPDAYNDNPSKGTAVQLPDGTRVSRRNAGSSTGKPALDIKLPGASGNLKVHVNTSTGGAVQIPEPATPAAPKPGAADPVPRAGLSEGPAPRIGGGVVAPPDGVIPNTVQPPGAADPDLPVIGDGISDERGW